MQLLLRPGALLLSLGLGQTLKVLSERSQAAAATGDVVPQEKKSAMHLLIVDVWTDVISGPHTVANFQAPNTAIAENRN